MDGRVLPGEFGIIEEDGIVVMGIIGEIEGHNSLPGDCKTTSYEHILPMLCHIEKDCGVKGVLFVINTVGGDVSCGLAIAEMIAGLSKPTVSLVVGDSHSIGVPIAVAAKHSYIADTATVVIHPVRMSGMVIGASQTYGQFESMQNRILGFIQKHSNCKTETLEKLMFSREMSAKDLGTTLVGSEAVEYGIIDKNGTIYDAFFCLQTEINSIE